MFEEEHIIALKDVILACRDAEARYETASSAVTDEALTEKFRNVSKARSRGAFRLETAIKKVGSFPKAPDPEKQALKSLWTHLKTAVAEDELNVLFHECLNLESEIVNRCATALQYTFPDEIVQTLAELKQVSTSFEKCLEQRIIS